MVIKITTGEITPIEIDGTRYGLKSKLDLSLSIQHRIVRLGTRMQSLDAVGGGKGGRKAKDDVYEKEYEEIDDQWVEGLCGLFVDATDELKEKIKKLGVDNRNKIFQVVFPPAEDNEATEKKTRGKTTK